MRVLIDGLTGEGARVVTSKGKQCQGEIVDLPAKEAKRLVQRSIASKVETKSETDSE